MINELKKLYACVTADYPAGGNITLSQLAALSRKKVGILVGEVLDGKLNPAGAASWRLSDLRVEMPTEYINEVPEGFSTLKQAQQIMQLNSEYIAGFRRSGLLTEHRQANKNNRYLYRTNDLYEFKKRYICANEIAKNVRCPVTVITEKLRFADIMPISGPGIDSSVVFVFERKDIESIDLGDALSVSDAYSMSGRKHASAPALDTVTWMSAAEAAQTLGLSIQQLFQLVNRGLLVATRPANAPSTERHHFRRKSVQELMSYISEMQDVSDLAQKLGVTKRQMLTRIYRLLKSKPIKLKNQLFIGLDEAIALERHFSLYLDAAQAAVIIDVKPCDIHNWKRLGHLIPIADNHHGYIQGPTLFDAAHIREFTRAAMTDHNNEYKDYIESLYLDFPTMLTWRHSITGEELRTGFCVQPQWLPEIRRLLENLEFLATINLSEKPLFRDFKDKRGHLSIHHDGGDDLADQLIESLEQSISNPH